MPEAEETTEALIDTEVVTETEPAPADAETLPDCTTVRVATEGEAVCEAAGEPDTERLGLTEREKLGEPL